MSSPVEAVAKPAGPMRRVDSTGVPALLARLVLGGLFIYMGVVKAAAPGAFLALLHEYELFPPSAFKVMNFTAIVLPWLEILCGVLLVLGIAVRGTALLLLGMLLTFTAVVAWRALGIYGAGKLAFCDVKFDCGCGSGEVYICRKLLENTGQMVLAAYLLWSRPAWKWLTVRWLTRPAPKTPVASHRDL